MEILSEKRKSKPKSHTEGARLPPPLPPPPRAAPDAARWAPRPSLPSQLTRHGEDEDLRDDPLLLTEQ